MQKETFVLWAKYNKIVNEKMDAIIKTLSSAEWNKDIGGYFTSVRGLCSHIYICDFNWQMRFSKLRDFAIFKDALFAREPYFFSEVLFEDSAEYLAKRPVLDEKIIAFVDELSDADMQSILKYKDSGGNPHELPFGILLMQTLNHDTHHRGMISLYLEMLGYDNDFSFFGSVLQG
jgi:uncharacterized damage-inducible protein DinB